MAESIPVNPIIIRYNGLFDFDGLYAAIIDWCKSYGYIWEENTYKHKVPSAKGAEQEWKWIAEKEVSDYLKYTITFVPHIWDMKELEIEKDGKRKSLTNGRIEIHIQGAAQLDWQNKFSKGRFAKFLGSMYKRMNRREIENIYIDNLYYRLWNLQALIKKFFDMQTKWHEYKTYLGED